MINKIHKHFEIWKILAQKTVLIGIKMSPIFLICIDIVGQDKYPMMVHFEFFMNVIHTGFSVSRF